MVEKLYSKFVNPTVEYRGKPFWSWNGKLEKEELLRQVQVSKEMGFGGFFMHSRTGLETEYLGEEWFELINACADEGERLGLEAWLYDEDRWPSGTAGGMVTAEPRYRMKFLSMQISDGDSFEWSDRLTAAFSAHLEGMVVHDYQPIFADTNRETLKGASVITFSVVEMASSSFYNGNTFVDTLNGEAIQTFISMTHEKYKKICGDRLGKSIVGIFTDEPHRGRLMSSFGSSPGEGKAELEYQVPWTYKLFDEFVQKFGYDLKARLPELFLWYKGEKVSQVKWHYVELLQQMFLDNFARPINEWCKENKLVLTGHALHEDSLTAQTAMSGSMMRFYEQMGYPGVDVLSEYNRNYWLVKQLSSVARQLGQKWLLSELYGCTGWQMGFESHKAVGDWQALFGINMRCHHLSWYTMQGEAKRDYPASIFHQSAWWREYKYVEDYFSRIGVVMSEGSPVCHTLVLNPVESVWCQVHPGWCNRLVANTPEIQKLEEQYAGLFHWLTGAQIDFDYGDEEMMSRLSSVEWDAQGSPLLKVGQASYRQVIVSGMTTIRSSTLKLLKEFMDKGGRVIFAGKAPNYVNAVASNAAVELGQRALTVPFDRTSIVEACKNGVPQLVSVRDAVTGQAMEKIFVQAREDDGNKYILLLNVDRENSYPHLRLTIQGDGYIQQWDCATGERYAVGRSRDHRIELNVDFLPGEEHLFVVVPNEDASLPTRPELVVKEAFSIDGSYKYELDEPNICVLDMASYRINNGEWQAETEILKIDRKVRKAFGLNYRAGNMLQPWYTKKTQHAVNGTVALRFDFYVDEIPPGGLELVVERPENFRIKLNGSSVDSSKRNGWWVDICFIRIPINSELLIDGKNTIELTTDFHQGVDIEAIYLLGDFGVRIAGTQKTVTLLPESLSAGSLTEQGLPFYSGKVTYIFNAPRRLESGEGAFLQLDGFAGACVRVNPDSAEEHIIAWQPYESEITHALINGNEVRVQVVLTRRNTFGPLHQIPLFAPGYGPDNFITEGEEFTNDYMLVPAGLLSPPNFIVKVIHSRG